MYVGIFLITVAPVVTFDGTEYVQVELSPTMITHVDDICLRFRTHKAEGLLFSTSNPINTDYLRVLIEDGRVKVITNLGGRLKEYFVGNNLNDNEWHTICIKRRANHLELWVDTEEHSIGKSVVFLVIQ